MFRRLFFLFAYLFQLSTTIPFDGIIHHSSDGSSYAFLSPPKTGNHASFVEEMSPSGTLAVAFFTGGENTANCSIAVSLLPLGASKFTPGVIVSERVNYSNQNPVLYWDNQTQILHLYHSSQLGNVGERKAEIWHLQSSDLGMKVSSFHKFSNDIIFTITGMTWSTAQPFDTDPGAFDRNRIIPTLQNDGVIIPCYNTSVFASYSFLL